MKTTLYHHPLDPFCRKVRLVLLEKDVPHELVFEEPWDRRDELLTLNPAGDVPVLVLHDLAEQRVLADSVAICEYLNETVSKVPLLGKDAASRAEVRRLVSWFDHKFYAEVALYLYGEKALKRLMGSGEPDSRVIRAGYANIHHHLDYIGWLTERRNWLAGDELSMADIAAAAHLSVIDYLGDVPWQDHVEARNWYARIKSRPTFRPLLGDHVPGLLPAKNYGNLDF
ncbi:MAG: glutathione S-transferase family protein [Alphaproteobacteria bacterium]|nr:glutathione S-transferase family protein [Alphaproteobacteria bacterium]